ncbi:MAG: SDR family oxidoreductase [Pseudolysinimonas sp.]
MTVLVVGGTGRLGSLIVQSLSADGTQVRVLTRNETSADQLRQVGIETTVGDLRDAGCVRRAVEGCASVVSAASGFGPMGSASPKSVDRDGNLTLIEEAMRANVEHFVLLSMHGARPDASLELLRMKYAAEQFLVSSGLSWTIIRPTAFLETYLDVVAQPMKRRNSTLVFGKGDVVVNFVSVSDVAALVCKALRDGDLRGRTIDWGGANLTLNDLSAALHEGAGRPGSTIHVPLGLLRAISITARPFSPFVSRVTSAAVWMNSRPAPFDAAPERRQYPDLAQASVSAAIAAIRSAA